MADSIRLTVSGESTIRLMEGDSVANKARTLETPRIIDGITFDGSANVMRYATCSTAAGTATKAVTVSGFSLVAGSMVAVRFSNTNTATTPKLNVSSTGAKAIRQDNVALAYAGIIKAGSTYLFAYDGTYWQIVGYASDDRGNVKQSDISVLSDSDVDALF